MLPIEEILPALKASLRASSCAVLVAPPGAGKTTGVPLPLLDQPWVRGGKLLLLEPRRLAARAAAARMAQSLGEAVGQTVGYRVRMDSRVSRQTRIEVVTEGVFTRMIQDDPGLDGVAGVLFDEFHERSLDADLGLALAWDCQGLLREDLRILVMSATLDGAAVAGLLNGAPVLESRGRAYPVETRYLGRDPAARIEDQTARAVRLVLAEEWGSVLVFLPGQGEILRTLQRLHGLGIPGDVDLVPLYGALDPREQDAAIRSAGPGRRKVVLATSIAETSLTIEGVRVVLDCGWSRVPKFEPSSGLTRLETVRVSRASADQRQGRAGRTEPGVCYRLWDELETRALVAFGRPEILEADLSGLALDLARWGARSAGALAFLDPPPAGAFAEARSLLIRLAALDSQGDLTSHGRALSDLPLPPRLAHMVLRGVAGGQGLLAARIAALLTERGLGGRDLDLRQRLEALTRDRSPRAREALALCDRWVQAAGRPVMMPPLDPGLMLAEAFPEWIARAKGKPGEYLLANGRGVHLPPTDALARETWLAVGELGGGEARDRILLAAPISLEGIKLTFEDRLIREDRLQTEADGKVRARRLIRLDCLVLEERLIHAPDPAMITAALLSQVRHQGLAALNLGGASRSLLARIRHLAQRNPHDWPDFSEPVLLSQLEIWLAPLLTGRRTLAGLADPDLAGALLSLLTWDRQRALEAAAPARWTAPTGTRLAIDYESEAGPTLSVRVQELYGLDAHPVVAGQPLVLALLSPAHRAIQVTRDLPAFWRGSWKDVRSDMRGRYPRHLWPEDPWTAVATTRAKPKGC
ncbi:MAG: ATP-dependent helicase HrpB [Caulobacter sp.]|nr:ATP-dependent helicase HrpB [Caulobacter sp.]